MRADSAFTVIVPARLASARLADKPLADIGGRPMVVRVLERAAESGAAAVWAAVEDEALAMAVEDAGFRAIRTGAHDSGSARLATAVEMLEMDDGEVVVNVQGDEPFMEPALIRAVAEALRDRPDCLCSTVCRKPRENAEVERPDVVKVVVDRDGAARYFSRQLIPYLRTGGGVVVGACAFGALCVSRRRVAAVFPLAAGAHRKRRAVGAAPFFVEWRKDCRVGG